MTNGENRRKPYDFDKDVSVQHSFNDDRVNNTAVFSKIVHENYENARSTRQANQIIRENIGRGMPPVMPKDERLPYSKSNGKLVYYGKMKDHQKSKLPKSLSLILAAAIAVGGISAITLGIKHVQNKSRDNSLARSQQSLEEVTFQGTNLNDLNVDQSQNSNLLILNSDINSLLNRYKQNPESISEQEVAQLLSATYQEGRDTVFPKIADAYNNYSQENDEFPQTIDSDHLVYWYSKDVGHYHIAYQNDLSNNPNGQAIAYNNNKLTNFITEQENMHDLYEVDIDTGTLKLKDGTTINQAINSLISGITDVNEIASSNIYFEKGLLGEKLLKIDEYQRENTISDNDKSSSSVINTNFDNTPDLDDEER